MGQRQDNLEKLERVYTGDPPEADLQSRVGLSLSGGGYKACTFHLGSLLRLYEMGLLHKIDRVSSVSGGSIAAAWLALQWRKLNFEPSGAPPNFHEVIFQPLWRFALSAKIQWSAIGIGVLDPFRRTSQYLEDGYRKHLFGDAKFRDFVQEPDGPRFTINSTSLQLNSLWRFTKNEARNWRVGWADIADLPVARLVAASSAFPPVLSPVVMKFAKGAMKGFKTGDVVSPEYTERAFLVDGGVYDNMGVETIVKTCRTVLVCNAGDPFDEQPSPATDWPSQLKRTISMMHRQAENNRIRWLFAMDALEQRTVAYWGVRGRAESYPTPGSHLSRDEALEAGRVKVELLPLKLREAQLLLAHGYSLADASARAFWPAAETAPASTRLPMFDRDGNPAASFASKDAR